MTSGQYWKIKALELERLRFESEAQKAAEQLRTRLSAAYSEAGLDFGTPYQFDDEKEVMTPVEPSAAPTGPQLAVDNTPNL